MPNVKLTIEYDGRSFCGWQIQAGSAQTVQGELHKALETVLHERIRHVQSAGRTDSGVHARGQVVNFYAKNPGNLDRLKLGVSSILRGRLAVLDVSIVPDDFHALKNCTSKCYSYRILQRSSPETMDKGFVWRISQRLDVDRMRAEAQCLVGQHDFSSFRAADCGANSPIKRIDSITITDSGGGFIEIAIQGSGFLRNMIRIIVGTLVELCTVEESRIGLGTMKEILDARDRDCAGITAPAHGLCFTWVRY